MVDSTTLADTFKDIEPIEQYPGGAAPIAPIPYPKGFQETMGYFRAIYDK